MPLRLPLASHGHPRLPDTPDASQGSSWESCHRAPAGQKSQRFGHDSVLCERSRGISYISLHRISMCIFLDRSGLSIGPRRGHFLLPSSENGCQVGNGPTSRKMKVFRMAYSIVENVPTPRESIFKLFLASQRPYGAKNQKWTEKLRHIKLLIFPLYLLRSAAWAGPWKFL